MNHDYLTKVDKGLLFNDDGFWQLPEEDLKVISLTPIYNVQEADPVPPRDKVNTDSDNVTNIEKSASVTSSPESSNAETKTVPNKSILEDSTTIHNDKISEQSKENKQYLNLVSHTPVNITSVRSENKNKTKVHPEYVTAEKDDFKNQKT